MAQPLISMGAAGRFRGEREDLFRDSFFGLAGSASQLFDHSPIAISRVEVHLWINPRGVPAQQPLNAAGMLEYLPPVEQGELPEAGEGVADGDLILCLAVLLAQVDLCDGPVVRALQPPVHQHEGSFFVIQVIDQLSSEIGAGVWLRCGKLGKDRKQLIRTPPVGPYQPAGPEVRDFPLAQLG